MSARSPLFRFVQVELPWPLGPPPGRYIVRPENDPAAAATQVIVFATLGAPERRLASRRRSRPVAPEPEPTPVTTGRATIIEVGDSPDGETPARKWLATAGEAELTAALAVLNRALRAFRLVTADPYVQPVDRRQVITARVGFGAGEQVADGAWTAARELPGPGGRRRRSRELAPQARLAAVLGARTAALVCEELALRTRLDLNHGRAREAALQLMVALDAAIAELSVDPHASELADRVGELRGRRDPVASAAQAALTRQLDEAEAATVSETLARIEAALRARAAADG